MAPGGKYCPAFLDELRVGRLFYLEIPAILCYPLPAKGLHNALKMLQCSQNCLLKPRQSKIFPGLTKNYEQLRKPRVERVRAYARTNGENYTLPDSAEQSRRGEMRY